MPLSKKRNKERMKLARRIIRYEKPLSAPQESKIVQPKVDADGNMIPDIY